MIKIENTILFVPRFLLYYYFLKTAPLVILLESMPPPFEILELLESSLLNTPPPLFGLMFSPLLVFSS
jgi:hypothetical protein